MSDVLRQRVVESDWANAVRHGGSLTDVVDVAPTDEVAVRAVGIPSVDAARRAARNAIRSPGVQLRRTADLLRREPGLTAPANWRGFGQRVFTGAAIEQLAQSGPVGAEVVALFAATSSLLPADLAAEIRATKPWVPLGGATVRARVAEAFGPGVVQIDAQPLGTTNVTQLHRGRHHDGFDVLVAITRPRVGRAVADDAESLAPLSALLDAALPVLLPAPARALSLPLLESLTRQLLARCDQRRVAVDAIELGLAAEVRGVSALAIARPIPGLVRRAAAAYEVPEGIDFDADEPSPPGHADVVQGLLGITVESALSVGVCAASLHPSHVLVGTDGTLHLVGGATLGRFSGESRKALVGSGMALIGGDRAGIVEGLVGMGILPADVDRDAVVELLGNAGLENIASLMGGNLDGAGVRRAAVSLLSRHEARVTPELMSFAISLVQMSRVLRSLSPELGVTELGMHALPRLMTLMNNN